jgi:molecular chaperone DnaJ
MNSQRQNRRGNDLRIKVDVTIGDIIKGVDKTLRYTRQVKCNTCDGYGGRDLTNCGICQGTGQRRVVQQTPFGTIQQIINCTSCNGHGQITKTNCNNCRGQGTVPKEETVDIKIPSGAVGGVNLSMNQMGNWIKLGQPGDLIIHIEEKQDPFFKRENNNLVYDQYVSVIDAILGKEYKISTPHGEMSFSVQPGTEHGKVLRFQGKGVPDLNLRGAIGDLFIRMNIKIPQNISTSEREILSKLKESPNFN